MITHKNLPFLPPFPSLAALIKLLRRRVWLILNDGLRGDNEEMSTTWRGKIGGKGENK